VLFLDVYDVATDKWTPLTDMNIARDHTGGGMVNGELCVAGGRKGDDPGTTLFNSTIFPTECYNIAADTCSTRADIPQGRAGSANGTTCDGKLMVAGGEGYGVAWNQVDVFDGTS